MLVIADNNSVNTCLALNTIYRDLDSGIFTYETKSAAIYLVANGNTSRCIKALAGGNLLFPKDVLFIAQLFEGLEKVVSKRNGGLL